MGFAEGAVAIGVSACGERRGAEMLVVLPDVEGVGGGVAAGGFVGAAEVSDVGGGVMGQRDGLPPLVGGAPPPAGEVVEAQGGVAVGGGVVGAPEHGGCAE